MNVFWEAKTVEKPGKIVSKIVACFNNALLTFFWDFSHFWLHFGRLQGFQKLKKVLKHRFGGAFGTRLDLQYDFGCDFGAIFADF